MIPNEDHLDGFIRDYERKWLDEPIPALAGHTPREAAANPTRRGDPGLMNPDRPRAALDLRQPCGRGVTEGASRPD
ncbi:hypothetical protein [Actinophytocola sp.]|uniref:hypothetical protein n=1 Tax=Actinophytocola sp. TaxID=1872138 RepID=UPI00389AAE9E